MDQHGGWQACEPPYTAQEAATDRARTIAKQQQSEHSAHGRYQQLD
jgi:hypothetical protein